MDTLVDKIVRGQANVDRMKAEIKVVIELLVGSLYQDEVSKIETSFIMAHGDHPGVQWELSPHNPVYPGVSCWSITGPRSKTLLYHKNARLGDVKKVYDSLECFVQLMLEEFPMLKQRVIMPLWDAAGPDPTLTK